MIDHDHDHETHVQEIRRRFLAGLVEAVRSLERVEMLAESVGDERLEAFAKTSSRELLEKWREVRTQK